MANKVSTASCGHRLAAWPHKKGTEVRSEGRREGGRGRGGECVSDCPSQQPLSQPTLALMVLTWRCFSFFMIWTTSGSSSSSVWSNWGTVMPAGRRARWRGARGLVRARRRANAHAGGGVGS
eukprot:358331-Chlamydomonas_euryale.AAC.1